MNRKDKNFESQSFSAQFRMIPKVDATLGSHLFLLDLIKSVANTEQTGLNHAEIN